MKNLYKNITLVVLLTVGQVALAGDFEDKLDAIQQSLDDQQDMQLRNDILELRQIQLENKILEIKLCYQKHNPVEECEELKRQLQEGK